MKRGGHVLSLARRIAVLLKPYVYRIEVAGSIRRGEKNPGDIDVVVIPKNIDKFAEFLKKKGKFLQGGSKKSRFRIEGIKVEFYYTTKESWGATLLAYSGKKGSNIGLRVVARMKGFKLNQYGLYKKGKLVAGRTERDIYKALGRPYKEPAER
jgi:DNA polymerase (family 10)